MDEAVIISPEPEEPLEPPTPPEEVSPPAESVEETPVEDTPETSVDGAEDSEEPLAETVEDILEGGGAAGGDTIIYELHLWDEHPMMTTSFADYSVAEGLLLLIFLFSFLRFMLDLTRRWF